MCNSFGMITEHRATLKKSRVNTQLRMISTLFYPYFEHLKEKFKIRKDTMKSSEILNMNIDQTVNWIMFRVFFNAAKCETTFECKNTFQFFSY